MNENILISIVIPCYNGEQTIPHLLDSILQENLDRIEVIVINDGSTDKTEAVCQDYCKRNAHINCISTKNQGVGTARNTGIKSSRGKYITFLDDDDEIKEGMLDLYKKAVGTDETVYSFNMESIFTETGKKRRAINQKSGEYDADEFLKLYFTRNIAFGVIIVLIKKSFLVEKAIFFDEAMRFAEDYLFLFALLLARPERIVYNNTIVYKYLINSNSVSSSKNFDVGRIDCFEKVRHFLDSSVKVRNLLAAKNFFLADMYCANVQIYLKTASARNSEAEKKLSNNKDVLNHFCFASPKYMFRILFFRFTPLKLLFAVCIRKNGAVK